MPLTVLGSMEWTALRDIGVGEGRNSTVHLADELQLGGIVAVKTIDKAKFGSPGEYFKEAKAMFRTTHTNVVPIHYACVTADSIALAMPYYAKGSLAKRLKTGPVQLSEALRVVRGVLAGLAHIHAKGFVHFDLKPSNVLFSDTDTPMIADFGQSQPVSASGVATAPDEMYCASFPPETLDRGVGTVAADIYQAGLLLYRAVNGDPHFKAQVPATRPVLYEMIRRGKFPDRQSFMPHVPKPLRTVIRKAMRLRPDERFQVATDMADAIKRVRLILDWLLEPMPGGGTRWRAARADLAELVVELTEQSPNVWQVQTFTETLGGPRRARARSENWRSGLSLVDARRHATDVFQRLRG